MPTIKSPNMPDHGPCDPTPKTEPQIIPNENPVPIKMPVKVPERVPAQWSTY